MNQVYNANQSISPLATQPPKKKSCLKIFLIVIGIVFVILILGYIGLRILYATAKDIPEYNSIFQYSKINIPDNENAYFDLLKNKDIVSLDKNQQAKLKEIIDGKTWDENFVKDIITNNQKALDNFDEALKKPSYLDPAFADPDKVTANTAIGIGSNKVTTVAQIKIAKSELENKQKNKESISDAVDVIEMGEKIQTSQSSIIEFLAGVKLKSIGFSQLEKIIDSGNFTKDDYKNYIDILNQSQKNRQEFKNTLKIEYLIYNHGLNDITNTSGLPINNFYYQPNRTKKLFADWINQESTNADKPCKEFVKSSSSNQLASSNKIVLIFTNNAIGKILVDMPISVLAPVAQKICDQETISQRVMDKLK